MSGHSTHDRILRCQFHHLPAVLLTSQSIANPGRKYWKCQMPYPEKCKFFRKKRLLSIQSCTDLCYHTVWADAIDAASLITPPASPSKPKAPSGLEQKQKRGQSSHGTLWKLSSSSLSTETSVTTGTSVSEGPRQRTQSISPPLSEPQIRASKRKPTSGSVSLVIKRNVNLNVVIGKRDGNLVVKLTERKGLVTSCL